MLKGYEMRTNYLKNTTSVSSCDLEQVKPTKYPNQKYVFEEQFKHCMSGASYYNKTRMKSNKILVCDIMTLSGRLKSDQL